MFISFKKNEYKRVKWYGKERQNTNDRGISLSTFLIRDYSWKKLIYFLKLGYMSKISLVM